MRSAPSVNLIWQLAAREMAMGQFKEIEPEHFCMALLKFADLSAAVIAGAVAGAETAEAIAINGESLRRALRERSIDSARARRALRGRFGKGGVPTIDGKVHRSSSSRALFEAAADLAARSGDELLAPLHLLTVLFDSPTPAIAEAVLGRSPMPQTPVGRLLEEHGRDLVRDAHEGKLPPASTANAACKVILQLLTKKECKSILLLTEQDELARDVVYAVAHSMAGDKPPEGLRDRILIDITGPFLADERKADQVMQAEDTGIHTFLQRLLAEAATRPEVILWAPAVTTDSISMRGDEWSSTLREALVKGNVRFVCRVAPKIFRECFHRDKVWKSQTEAVWLDNTSVGTVPRQL